MKWKEQEILMENEMETGVKIDLLQLVYACVG